MCLLKFCPLCFQIEPEDDGTVVIDLTDIPPSELPSTIVVVVTAPPGENVTVSNTVVEYCEEVGEYNSAYG